MVTVWKRRPFEVEIPGIECSTENVQTHNFDAGIVILDENFVPSRPEHRDISHSAIFYKVFQFEVIEDAITATSISSVFKLGLKAFAANGNKDFHYVPGESVPSAGRARITRVVAA